MMVGDLARGMPRINTALENRQADYQTSMVEVEGGTQRIFSSGTGLYPRQEGDLVLESHHWVGEGAMEAP